MTGVFIYLKIDGYVTGWYNVVGYVGDPEPNTTSFLVDRPVIKYNNEYMELLWEPGKGITNLGVITENLQLVTSQEKYFTIIKDSSEDNIIGTIVNDQPILYDISIRGIADENNKFTFYTYNVTLDKVTLNAVRKDSPIIQQYGPSVTVNKDNVDFDVEHNTYGCEFIPEAGSESLNFPPINGYDTTHTAIIFQFNTIVSKGSNFSDLSSNPIIILDSAHNQKMAAEQVTFDLDENGNYTNTGKILFKNTVYTVTEDGQEITKNSGQLVDEGVYILYIPNAIFKVSNDNVDYIVAKFIVSSGQIEEPFQYTVTPSFTEQLKEITVLTNISFNTCEYSLTTLSGEVVQTGRETTSKTDRTIVKITLNTPITAQEDTKYKFNFILLNAYGSSDQGTLSEIITVKAPQIQYLSKYIISGPTKIRRVGNYTYTVTPYPAKAIDADYILSIKEENSKATLENNVLSISTLDEDEEYDVTLVATQIASPNKTAEFKIKVAYIDDQEIVDLTGLSIKGTDLIYEPGIYSYNVLVNPENATFSSYYWESNSSYFTTSSGVIRVDTLPSEEQTVTIKAISDQDSSIYDIKKITIASSYIPLQDIEILGPKEIIIGNSAIYTIQNNPSNATSWYSRWEDIKMSDGSSLKSGYNFDSNSGTLSISNDAEEGIVTLAATNGELRTTFNVTITHKRIPTSDHSIKNITVSGQTSINSVGNYNYKAILDPSDTEDTLVSWSLIDCYYSGISINKLGILQITRMPVNNAIIKIRCKSVNKPNIEAVQEVTLIAASFEEDIEPSNEFVFSFYPEAGAVTQLKDIRISISNSSSVTRQLPVTEITLDGPVSDKHLSGEMDLRAVNGQALKLSLANTYTSFGTYKITFPEGFFNIDGEESPATTVTYTIKDISSDTSDDKSDTFGGLLTYGSNINRFRIKGSDTVVVAEVGGSIPTIYLNPQVYYINKSGNYAIVTDGQVNLRIKYRTLEGIQTLEFNNIIYNKGYNLTDNIFNKIPNLRDAEIIVTINFNYLSVSKHFKLVFVDQFNYTKIRNNSSFSLLVNDVTEEFEQTTTVYGCTRVTGYEVIQTITKKDESGNGTVYKLCDDRTINKLRLGNLTNIYDERFGLKQPHGYGLYSENVFLTGSFVLNNGRSLIDIDKEITLINGNVERAQQLLNDTKTELQNQYKDTIKDLANTLELMHQIGDKSIARLDDIGSDGVISVDEKAAVQQEWLSCISEFNRIQKVVFDYKEKLADDKVYKDLQLANRDLVQAFYDLNQLITGLILKDITVNTYDSNPDPTFTQLSINQYINDSERIINFVDKKDINWKSEDEETPEETEENPPKESTEIEEGLKIYNYSLEDTDLLYYNPEKYIKYNPIYLYPTYLEKGKVKEETINTTFIEGQTIKENEKLKLNFFYESKEDKNFTYSWIIRKYREVYEKVQLLLSKASATESIVEQFNTEGEKAADEAIRNFMGNLQDTIIYTGADFSIFAMGSAGIAITNPDLTYTIGGSNLAGYINVQLDKLKADDEYKKLIQESDKLNTEIKSLGDYDELSTEDKAKWEELNNKLLKLVEEATSMEAKAKTQGMVNYYKDLENVDPSIIEPDNTTVGDGDEQLYLFGDKVKVLTTDYEVDYDDENPSTKVKYYKVRFKDENGVDIERYIKQYDLKFLRGNYLDRQLSLGTNSGLVTEDLETDEASTKARVVGPGLRYYTLNNGNIERVQDNTIPTYTQVTILYKYASLFENGYLNSEFIKSNNLEIGKFDEYGNLVLNEPYVRAYNEDLTQEVQVTDQNGNPLYDENGDAITQQKIILGKGVLEARGAQIYSYGTNSSLYIGDNPLNSNLAEDQRPGLFIKDDNGNIINEYSGRIINDPVTTNFKDVINSTYSSLSHDISGKFSPSLYALGGDSSSYAFKFSASGMNISSTDKFKAYGSDNKEYTLLTPNDMGGTYTYAAKQYQQYIPYGTTDWNSSTYLSNFASYLIGLEAPFSRVVNLGYFDIAEDTHIRLSVPVKNLQVSRGNTKSAKAIVTLLISQNQVDSYYLYTGREYYSRVFPFKENYISTNELNSDYSISSLGYYATSYESPGGGSTIQSITNRNIVFESNISYKIKESGESDQDVINKNRYYVYAVITLQTVASTEDSSFPYRLYNVSKWKDFTKDTIFSGKDSYGNDVTSKVPKTGLYIPTDATSSLNSFSSTLNSSVSYTIGKLYVEFEGTRYKTLSYGNGLLVGYNKNNYFGAYYKDAGNSMAVGINANGYGIEYGSWFFPNQMCHIFNGHRFLMPMTIGYVTVQTSKSNGKPNVVISHSSIFDEITVKLKQWHTDGTIDEDDVTDFSKEPIYYMTFGSDLDTFNRIMGDSNGFSWNRTILNITCSSILRDDKVFDCPASPTILRLEENHIILAFHDDETPNYVQNFTMEIKQFNSGTAINNKPY